MNPFFSIIIPCYNSGTYLAESVDSILGQSFEDYEIILVNDGSTDPLTLEIIASLEGSINVIHQTNRGQGYARNQAIKFAQGDFLAFLDSDDLWQPFSLEIFHSVINQCNAQLCFAEVHQFTTESDFKLSAHAIEALSPDYSCFKDFGEFYHTSSKNVFLQGAFCVKRDALGSTVGYLEERVNGEDLHFILQLVQTKRVAWIRNPAIMAYRIHELNSTKNYYKGALGIKSLYRERACGLYDNLMYKSKVVSSILSSHARSISILMLRQRRITDALQLYWLSIADNISLLRVRYLVGFWFEVLINLLKRSS